MKQRYQLREKAFSLKSSYVIKDPVGNEAYEIKGKFLSFGKKYSFREKGGKEIYIIEQRRTGNRQRFRILQNGKNIAELTKDKGWMSDNFDLDIPGRNDYTISGSFWKREYTFKRNRKVVAEVSKKRFTLGDTYGVEIEPNENRPLILATAVIIDLMMENDKSRKEKK
ncbi:MAG: LURP-one-related family protein [Bacteroidota bacterium]